jgi:hypothetical protein
MIHELVWECGKLVLCRRRILILYTILQLIAIQYITLKSSKTSYHKVDVLENINSYKMKYVDLTASINFQISGHRRKHYSLRPDETASQYLQNLTCFKS